MCALHGIVSGLPFCAPHKQMIEGIQLVEFVHLVCKERVRALQLVQCKGRADRADYAEKGTNAP